MRGSSCLILALSCVIVAAVGRAGTAGPDVTVTIPFAHLTSEGGALLMPGTFTVAPPGAPLLPVRIARILLPPDTDPRTIQVEVRMLGVRAVAFPEPVAPAPEQTPLSNLEPPPAEPDPSIYETDAYYPASDHDVVGVAWNHGFPVLMVQLFPVRWNPVSGRALVAEAAKVRVHRPGGGRVVDPERGAARRSPHHRSVLARLVDNPGLLEGWDDGPAAPQVEDWQYLVVTSADLLPAFQTLAAHRATVDGLTTHVVTLDTVLSTYPGRDSAEKVRNLVVDGYLHHGTRSLVLGGDADVLPTRWCYGRAGSYFSSIPTDFYFGEVDGDWNADGSYYWCQLGDDVDLLAEVAVGRISASTLDEAQNQVAKIVAYEAWGAAPFHAVLAGERADSTPTWGGDHLDYVWERMGGIPRDTLYDRDGGWSGSDLVDGFLNSGLLNILFHVGHASATYVMRLDADDVVALVNSRPFFAYSQGCDAGSFDTTDCMAEQLTVHAAAGAFAVIMNARHGFYAPGSPLGASNLLHREFAQAMFEEHVTRLGDANLLSKNRLAGLEGSYNCNRWCAFGLTLFGDPATPIHWRCQPDSLRVVPESLRPGFAVMEGDPVPLVAALHDDCAEPVPSAGVEATFSNGDPPLTLADDGLAPDLAAADGHFSGLWTPGRRGPVVITLRADGAGLAPASSTLVGSVGRALDYQVVLGYGGWVDTSSGVPFSASTLLGNLDDGAWPVELGFDLHLYGGTFTSMIVGTNGLMQLQLLGTFPYTGPSFPIPYAGDENGLVAPWWADLDLSAGGSVRPLVLGTAPNRSLTVEWTDVPHYPGQGDATFQVSLYEGTDEIVLRYQDTVFGEPTFDHGADAVVGIEDPIGLHGIEVGYNEPLLSDGLSVTFTPVSSHGALRLDRDAYPCTSSAVVQLTDTDLEGMPSAEVVATSQTEPDGVPMTLVASGDPRLFRGMLPMAEGSPLPDSLLQVHDGDIVTVHYQEAHPQGERTVAATVDCAGPVITSLTASPEMGGAIVVSWTTDEPSTSWAQASPAGTTAEDSTLTTDHRLTLGGIAACSVSTVAVTSTDSPGNTASAGPIPVTGELSAILRDDVEGGPGAWMVEAAAGPDPGWSIVLDPDAPSPLHSWSSPDTLQLKDARLTTGPFLLNPGYARMSFLHHTTLDDGPWLESGGVLEVSVDGGPWLDVTAAGGMFIRGGYTLQAHCEPISGRWLWSGTSPTTVDTLVDLSALAGSEVSLRFRLLSCLWGGRDPGGWWVDDVVLVSSCAEDCLFADDFELGDCRLWDHATGE